MSWIEEVKLEEATGKLKKIYEQLTKMSHSDEIPNVLQVQSLNPGILKAHLDLYKAIMFGKSNLSRADREMIAVVVSGINSCHY
ncbi:carboxymuconolactone decarboxylase family protein [Natroniella sulfidigena]|uniref:carboxymuconolactone decarboxylase family protein n=1 Tax=Natroniella sulfidigena TaxID=723921 RepID=UPI00200AC0C9|nr:carboxymuconolactone decarboxylase family protein [Natroniella sulfidigena]MCK8818200.1 carboxymuconolactone decarboxylase family protein [Natroniella sulfidigena]